MRNKKYKNKSLNILELHKGPWLFKISHQNAYKLCSKFTYYIKIVYSKKVVGQNSKFEINKNNNKMVQLFIFLYVVIIVYDETK